MLSFFGGHLGLFTKGLWGNRDKHKLAYAHRECSLVRELYIYIYIYEPAHDEVSTVNRQNISSNHMWTLVVSSFLSVFFISQLPYFWPMCLFMSPHFTLTNPLSSSTTDLQFDEIWQLLSVPQVVPLPRVYPCWGRWPTFARPLPDSLQSCALQTQCQLWPLYTFYPQKGANCCSLTI